jgi:hypothetical protein
MAMKSLTTYSPPASLDDFFWRDFPVIGGASGLLIFRRLGFAVS